MQRIGQNGGLCHGEQKANSYNSRKNSLKMLLLLLLLLYMHVSCRTIYICRMQVNALRTTSSATNRLKPNKNDDFVLIFHFSYLVYLVKSIKIFIHKTTAARIDSKCPVITFFNC